MKEKSCRRGRGAAESWRSWIQSQGSWSTDLLHSLPDSEGAARRSDGEVIQSSYMPADREREAELCCS